MQAVLVFVALLSTFTFSTLALAAKEGEPLSGREELVIGRQHDHLNYFWTSKRGGEENSTFLDIAQRFAEEQGKEVKIHFYHDRNDLLKALVEGDVDLAMGYAQTKDATSYFSYSKPIFNVRSVIWLHRAELRDKVENSLSWGCVRGSFYCYVMKERGLTNIASFNSHRVMMQAIASGEIDAIYTDVITAEQYLSVRTPGEWVGDLEYVNTLPSYPASILTSKDRPQLHQDLVDYVESIQASLNRNQRSLVDVLGQEMMLKALKLEYGHSTIRYSFEKNMRPFSYESSGERVGYIHDLMSMLSRKSGVVFEYVAPSDTTPLEMLKNGEIDLLPGYAEDTDSSLVFTKSFGQVYWKLVESNNKSGNDRVAILDRSDRIVMRKAEQVFDTLPIIYQDLDKLLIDIKQGKIDYAYIPSYVVDFHAYGSNDDAFNVVLSPTVKSLSVDMGFTLSSQSSLLQRIMNDVLKQVSSNEIEMLQLKHHQVVAQYGYDKSNIAVIALSILSLFLIVVIVIQRRANRLSQSLLNADKQVKENSERLQWLRDLLDRLPSMIAIYDEDGALVMSNKAFNQHGMECKSFKKGHCLLKNKTYKQDNMDHLVCKCKFSRRYLRVIENQISGMHDDGRYKMMVYDDYTALEKQKDELKASNEKALRAIHSRDLFLATVSMNFARLLRHDWFDGANER
ncbi:sensory box sensor histidine kinase [Vibrio ponticus]|nr:sensory box sensor histidine kinase [Vibrio ponticus]